MRKYLGGSGGMLPRKILKVETNICAVWGILEANLKKSSTLKFIMNISLLTSICIHRSIIWIFIGKKVCLSIFSNRKYFFSTIFISARILVSATKLANIKIIWSKLETKEQTKFRFIGPYFVTPGTESLTWHIDLLDAVTHTHLRLANLAKHKPVSTFSFSHLQNFHLFFTDASIPTLVLSRLLQVRHERMRFTTRWWAAFRVKSFKAAVINLQVRRTLLIRIQNGRQSAYNPQTADLQVMIGLLPFVVDSAKPCTEWWWPKQNRFTPFENVPCKNEIEAWGKFAKFDSENLSHVKYSL